MNEPTPGQLRYIALLTLELGLPEPRIETDAQARQEIAALLAEKRKRRILKQEPLTKAIYNTLAWNGKAMWYEDVTNVVVHDYPQLHATSKKVLALLQMRKDVFMRITAGTYFLKGKLEGQQYPLM